MVPLMPTATIMYGSVMPRSRQVDRQPVSMFARSSISRLPSRSAVVEDVARREVIPLLGDSDLVRRIDKLEAAVVRGSLAGVRTVDLARVDRRVVRRLRGRYRPY